MIRPVTFLLGLPALASADDWELFEQHCLFPMEQVALDRPSSLARIDAPEYASASIEVFSLPDSDASLIYFDGQDGLGQSCGLIEATFSDLPERWVTEALKRGDYETVPSVMSHSGLTLRSTDLREPRIEVHLQPFGGSDGPLMIVTETDLES